MTELATPLAVSSLRDAFPILLAAGALKTSFRKKVASQPLFCFLCHWLASGLAPRHIKQKDVFLHLLASFGFVGMTGLATPQPCGLLRDAFPEGSLGEVTKFRTKYYSQAKILLFSRLYCASTYTLENNKTSDLSIEGFALNFVGMTGFEAQRL